MLMNPPQKMLDAVTTTATGPTTPLPEPNGYGIREIQIELKGTGAVAATVILERTLNNGLTWSQHAGTTFSLSGTGSDSGFWSLQTNGGLYRLRVTAISGTGATINAWIA